MRLIELEIEGVKTVATLLEDVAPRTCQVLWDTLPFESTSVHSHWSGGRLHTTRHLKLDVDVSRYPWIENPSSYQAPGDVVIEPQSGELNVVYAPGRYQWMGSSWPVTRVAAIEGDFSLFARKIERLQWEGAKNLLVRQGGTGQNPAQPVEGVRIKIECDGLSWVAELFDERVPKLCEAILNTLPLEAPITNMHSSGNIFHIWHPIPHYPEEVETKRERPPVDYQGKQIGTSAIAFYSPREARGTFRGDILCDDTEGLRIVHGPIQMDMSQFTSSSRRTQKVGRIVEGDLDELHRISSRIDWEGARIMRVFRL